MLVVLFPVLTVSNILTALSASFRPESLELMGRRGCISRDLGSWRNVAGLSGLLQQKGLRIPRVQIRHSKGCRKWTLFPDTGTSETVGSFKGCLSGLLRGTRKEVAGLRIVQFKELVLGNLIAHFVVGSLSGYPGLLWYFGEVAKSANKPSQHIAFTTHILTTLKCKLELFNKSS